CGDPLYRDARGSAVSERAVILHDLQNPGGGFTDAEYADFAKTFDELVYPTVVANFGEPTDIDRNGRVVILFTSAVNELASAQASSYVAGFFYARDLFPKANTPALSRCEASNEAELLYMMTPDPLGSVKGNVRSKRFVRDRTVAVLGHELQHLINASRRLRVVGSEQWNEEFWLNEGLSHIAEELLFYAATGLEPRREITGARVRGAVRESFERYQWVNSARYAAYLRDPAGASAFSGPDLANRGASWAFLRYAADRRAGDDPTLWRRLVDTHAIGYANLAAALGVSPITWMHDWAVSFYTDDFIPVEPRFRQPSWNFRSVLPTLGNGVNSYPLRVDHVVQRSPAYQGTLVAGGAGILRFSVPAGGRAHFRTTSGGAAPPSHLRLTLVRTW
ncbi:MAG TPA: hypothetical protein VMN39_05400, partial [Longimicrobiaceae bacterium]|nr:hypothetical protein [Longimicrobiaceae bacterium]